MDNGASGKKSLSVIGKSLEHTLSPKIFEKFGRDYGVRELQDEKAVAEFLKGKDFDGVNVTVPYKTAVIPFLDVLSEEAKAIGAVNTVVKRGGKLYGYNTDVLGMRYATARAGIILKDRIVAILGSGGTSRTARYLAAADGAKETLTVSRSGALNYTNVIDRQNINIIINTTPVGMYPDIDGRPVDLSLFRNLEGIFDCVYNPLKTSLILQAEKLGIKCAGGLSMLVEQARAARDIFFDERSGVSDTERVYDELYREQRNIVLIGMPGCGKTAVGRKIAEILKKDFVDTDEEIVKLSGKSIEKIFFEDGEQKFRQTECEVIKTVCGRLNTVIAVGGGAPMNANNSLRLRHNGLIVLLIRDTDKLARNGRPLSENCDLSEMYNARISVYNQMKDIAVDNNGGINDTIKELINAL